ncbi:MAG: FdtA/QdtA family cupin domain-containing protein [Bacteroidia bacterium]|jgi:dTDP-4-dehydrorhamnose 3,5-epimerase-like enzyme|nr:FdtA/QdtA family cupin domain-containing protein [Bacteroidia bacterium]
MTKQFPDPHMVTFNKVGEPALGYLSIADDANVPFKVQRVFWTYHTPESIVRGRHAHHVTEQLLVAVTGRILVTTDNGKGQVQSFVLDEPNKGVYIPPNVWHTMQYSHTAVQMVLASTPYEASDYIRSFDEFIKVWGNS